MCERYDISRITVRQALSNLVYEGLIYSTPGKGSYVADPPLHEELKPLRSFTEDARRRGKVASSRVLEAAISQADAATAENLNLHAEEELVRLKRLRLMDDMPIAIHTACLPHHLCPHLLRNDLSSRSLFEVLRSVYGLHLARADTALRAALAWPEEQKLLELSSPVAVLIMDQTTYLDDGTVVEYLHGVYRGDSYTLHMRN